MRDGLQSWPRLEKTRSSPDFPSSSEELFPVPASKIPEIPPDTPRVWPSNKLRRLAEGSFKGDCAQIWICRWLPSSMRTQFVLTPDFQRSWLGLLTWKRKRRPSPRLCNCAGMLSLWLPCSMRIPGNEHLWFCEVSSLVRSWFLGFGEVKASVATNKDSLQRLHR